MPPLNTEQARWFAEEMLPHEAALRAYLRGFVTLTDIDDLVQESHMRPRARPHRAAPVSCPCNL